MRFSCHPSRRLRRSLLFWAIAFVVLVVLIFLQPSPSNSNPSPPVEQLSSPPPLPTPAAAPDALTRALANLPPPQAHSLPASLAQWQAPRQTGDYFDQVQPVVIGYLVWSQFPITVFVEPVTAADHSNPFTAKRAQTWVTAVQKAIQEWTPYLPLQQVENRKKADIAIWRSAPPLRIEPSSGKETGDRSPLPISRARSAETRFELYARRPTSGPPGSPSVLSHRVAVYIRPDQAGDYLQAAARHELGHALGIWGHSPQPTDALYFSQVRNPAKISARDLNTLKRVYEQPTRLGWALAADR